MGTAGLVGFATSPSSPCWYNAQQKAADENGWESPGFWGTRMVWLSPERFELPLHREGRGLLAVGEDAAGIWEMFSED